MQIKTTNSNAELEDHTNTEEIKRILERSTSLSRDETNLIKVLLEFSKGLRQPE